MCNNDIDIVSLYTNEFGLMRLHCTQLTAEFVEQFLKKKLKLIILNCVKRNIRDGREDIRAGRGRRLGSIPQLD